MVSDQAKKAAYDVSLIIGSCFQGYPSQEVRNTMIANAADRIQQAIDESLALDRPDTDAPLDVNFDNLNRACGIFMTLVTHCNGLAWDRDRLWRAVYHYAAAEVNVEILRGVIATMQPTSFDPRVVQRAVTLQAELMKAVPT